MTADEVKSTTRCWVINAPYDVIGGAGNRFRAEVEHFRNTEDPMILMCRPTVTRQPICPTVNFIVPTRLLPLFLLEVFTRTISLISHHKRVVFLVHDPISCLGVSVASKLFRERTRTFLVVHGPMSLEQMWLSRSPLKKFVVAALFSTIERLVYKLADKLIAVSEYEVKYLADNYGVRSSVSLIRNGIEIERFELARNERFREGIGIDRQHILLINVGHLYTYRGLSTLFEAIAIVKGKGVTSVPVKLLVVGKGSDENYLSYKQEVDSLGLTDVVMFLGDRPDIPEILSAGDIYVERFSKKVNGIGIAIMEAMAAGLPVVTGHDWITAKLLHDGENCILVEKEDSLSTAEGILSLVVNTTLREKIGNGAKSLAKSIFSMESMLRKCEWEYAQTGFTDS